MVLEAFQQRKNPKEIPENIINMDKHGLTILTDSEKFKSAVTPFTVKKNSEQRTASIQMSVFGDKGNCSTSIRLTVAQLHKLFVIPEAISP